MEISFLEMSSHSEDCIPETFYNVTSKTLAENAFMKYLNIAFVVFTLVNSPFLIILPFCMTKLKNNCRRIISMIVLSDFIAIVNQTLYFQMLPKFESDELFGLCVITDMISDISLQWSQLWSMLLILNVLFTLRPRFGLNGSGRIFFLLCHVLAWPSGVIFTVVSEGVLTRKITFTKNYLVGPSCQGQFDFVLSDDGKECLMDSPGKILMMIFYIILLVELLISALAYFRTFYEARRMWIKSRREESRIRESNTDTRDLDDGYGIAHDNSYTVYKTTVRLSTAALLYVISFLPIILSQFWELFNGPIQNKLVREPLDFWFEFVSSFIAALNIVLYGYLSPLFRGELLRLKSRLIWRCFGRYRTLVIRDNHMGSTTDLDFDASFDFDLSVSSGIGKDASCDLDRQEDLR